MVMYALAVISTLVVAVLWGRYQHKRGYVQGYRSGLIEPRTLEPKSSRDTLTRMQRAVPLGERHRNRPRSYVVGGLP